MKRAIVGLFLIAMLPAIGRSQSLGPEQREATSAFAAGHQNPDGGFSAEVGGPSSLGSTTASIRVLRYTGGSIPDVLGCIDFVRSCADDESGGFSQTPGGDPDVGTTASGLMAIGELHLDDDDLIDAAVAYLTEHAEAFPEVRIAVAGMEAVERRSPAFEGWSAAILDRRNDNGTWGKGPSTAFETGGTAAALLRMGVDFDRDDAVIAAIREGQQPDGGWSADEGPSDLSSTYRVVRGAFMMRAAPDLSALRGFVGRCRRDDGGYAARPDEEASSIGATYMATILLRWADLLEGQEPVPETAGYRSLFNGQDLEGWEGDTSLWSASDGMLVGDSPGIDHNEFLAAEGEFGDFALRFSFRLDEGMGNSGVMFRSQRLPGHEMTGYQADIGEGYWGCLYDESRRNRVLQPASDEARAAVREGGWNQYEIRAMGPNIALTLNDQRSVTFEEEDEAIADSGRIAVQIHSGEAMEVRFRDLRIQSLPRPSADDDPKAPGFHLRTLEGSEGDYRYSVFVPEGYDGAKPFPVVLFLHGSGERGTDGVTPAQVGLGPIIAADPSAHPYIAVFPQARASWQADTADAALALRALDEVMADYKAEPSRVVLTGLSMGGRGTWSIGTAHPERFSALVPICGPGEVESLEPIRGIPTWVFVGDMDRPTTLGALRATARTLRDLGAPVRYTEYRGVGHNSWDRAYSEPELVDWMLRPHRLSQ